MNKQTKTYALLALVLIIWGIIAYKMFGSMSSTVVESPVVTDGTFKPKTVKKKDTFSIIANYRDPFLGTFPEKKQKVKSKIIREPREPQIEVTYTGYITDTNKKSKIFFVTIGGQQLIMNQNDEINGVRLVNGTATHIRIQSNGKSRVIKLKEQ